MARISAGAPIYKVNDSGSTESATTTDKSLNVTLINFKPYDLEVNFDLDGERYRVAREYVTAEPEVHPDDSTVDRGALGAAGGTVKGQGEDLTKNDKDSVSLDDLDVKDSEGREGTPKPTHKGSYPGDGEES